jgi:hypothetical protein
VGVFVAAFLASAVEFVEAFTINLRSAFAGAVAAVGVNKVQRAIKAAYNFFAGDVSILVGTSIAFVGAFLLRRFAHTPNALVGLLFVAFLLAGLTDSLNREVVGRTDP